MRFVDPRACVMYLLNTGDKSVLQKVDPARKAELTHWLKQAQKGLLNESQAKTQYQALLAKAQATAGRSERPQGVDSIKYDADQSRNTWPTGQCFNDLRKNQFRYVQIGATTAAGGGMNADGITQLLTNLEKGE